MLIPFADNLNHEDVCIDYITLTHEFLSQRMGLPSLLNDYKDFSGLSSSLSKLMKTRSHHNRLNKYISLFGTEKIFKLEAIWDVDQILHNLESSSDEEDTIHEWTSDESSESVGHDFDLHFDPSDKYFVMRTKENCSFRAGEQVYNCYGRLNNFDLLLDYGFCLYPNRYDSVHFRMHKNQIFIPTTRRIKFKTYNLKLFQLNLKFLHYIRKRNSSKSEYRILSTRISQEIRLVQRFKLLIQEYYQMLPTLIDYDMYLLSQPQSSKKKSALSKYYLEYRISRKEILLSQIDLADNLLGILSKISEGASVRQAHWSEKSEEQCRIVYPLRQYLYKLEYGELW